MIEARIHAAALRLLEETGIRLKHPATLDLLRRQGVRVEGDIARFTERGIMERIAQAPPAFTLHARNPDHDAAIGGGSRQYVAGYGAAAVIEEDGRKREARLEDHLALARLVHQAPCFRINGGILAQPTDLPAEQSHLVMLYAAARLSDKALLGIPGRGPAIEDTLALAAILCGGEAELRRRPQLLTMISTISPLVVDDMALDSVWACARWGQPLIVSPAPAAGTTGPIALAGNLALATAEALAVIAVAQALRPGLPVIFGLQCYGADLRSGNIAIGSPAYARQAQACARLARYYRLPSRGGGAVTDARSVDVQAASEGMLAIFAAAAADIDLIVHAAGILESFGAVSLEKFVLDLEMIRMVEDVLAPIAAATDDDLALEVIRAVGPGGQFLTHMDTVRKCRTHSWNPTVALRGALPEGCTPAAQLAANLQTQKRKMLAAYTAPAMDPGIRRDLESFLIRRAGVDAGVIARIHAAAEGGS